MSHSIHPALSPHYTPRASEAPLRLLYPLTIIVGLALGLGFGLGLGAVSGNYPYYVAKEFTLGAVGGITAPLFLIGVRRFLRAPALHRRLWSYLVYYIAGTCAGSVLIGVNFLFPQIRPPDLALLLYPFGVAGIFPLVGLFADSLHEARVEQQRTKEIFGKYVSESIAQRVLAAQPQVSFEGEKREVTVLISDIRGFTRMIQDLGAAEVVHTLNDYFARMIDVIFEYEGTVNKFIGDAIVVLYNAPQPQSDATLRAVWTARTMQEVVRALNQERVTRGQPPLGIGIAIDVGEAICGNVGSPRRLEYTAIGAPVNTAYHLASLVPAGAVYITERVYRELEARVVAHPATQIELKGDTGRLNVYEVEYRNPALS